MRLLRAISIGLFVLAGSACHKEAPTSDDSKSESGAPGAKAAKVTSAKALFEALRDRIDAGDYDGVRALTLDIKTPDGKSVSDLLIQGIRSKRKRGDWAYSPEALDRLISRADEVHPPEPALANKLTMMFGKVDERLGDASRLRVFEAGGARVLLAKIDGSLKLVFWEHLTALTETEAGAPAATASPAEP